jgi:hypothetical protein
VVRISIEVFKNLDSLIDMCATPPTQTQVSTVSAAAAAAAAAASAAAAANLHHSLLPRFWMDMRTTPPPRPRVPATTHTKVLFSQMPLLLLLLPLMLKISGKFR